METSLVHNITSKTSWFEPPRDKTNIVVVRPAKTQISLGIRPVWSESLLSAWWKLSYPLSAQRRLWSDWADAQADLSPCWQTVILLVLSWGGSFVTFPLLDCGIPRFLYIVYTSINLFVSVEPHLMIIILKIELNSRQLNSSNQAISIINFKTLSIYNKLYFGLGIPWFKLWFLLALADIL